MTVEKSLSEILTDQMNMVSNGISAVLREHISEMPSAPPLSEATISHIKKRVGPKTQAKYMSPEGAVDLLSLEVLDLVTRISRYQYIERYREHFTQESPAMGTAFVMHMHILRGSEIYVIMERCGIFLEFFYEIAQDLKLNPTKKLGKDLEKRFKKLFERHLRERHRIVHAHERPSVISRITAISSEIEGEDRVMMEESFQNLLEVMLGPLSKIDPNIMKAEDGEALIKNINEFRLRAVDRECFEMWSVLLESINKTIDRARLLKKAASV